MDATEAMKRYITDVPHAAKYLKWLMAWDSSKTIMENQKDLNIPNFPSAHNFCVKFNLGFREGYHRKVRTPPESLKVLIKHGLNKSEIARLLGVSPQRIEQLIKGKNVIKKGK
jgi:hypothetical protein